uniref:Uncharacterized protein n=1 Tax=Pygocentrus nattereri TaxID=42514 RepID=A0A3B4EA35_PYGNA
LEVAAGGPCMVELKTKQQSETLLYTYFQGDINSKVDEHFSRALRKLTKPKGDNSKNKRTRRSAKTGNSDALSLIIRTKQEEHHESSTVQFNILVATKIVYNFLLI